MWVQTELFMKKSWVQPVIMWLFVFKSYLKAICWSLPEMYIFLLTIIIEKNKIKMCLHQLEYV